MADGVEGNRRFALDLYGRLRQQPGNRFFSPSSISTALAMAYAGARGETARQMAAALHFTLPPERLHAAFGALTRRDGGKAPELAAANALWGQEGLPFRPDFRRLVEANYGPGLHTVDFRGDTEAARQTINTWVEHQTRGEIKDLLGPSALSPLTRLVLTSAIHFKAAWASPFPEAATSDDPFRRPKGEAVRVRMMSQDGTFGYFDGGHFEALELPYQGGDLSMVVALPRAVDGLGELEGSLTTDWLPELTPRRVAVTLPEFKVEEGFDLQDVLAGLGMPDAFSEERADFSGMTGGRDLFLSKAIHKAFVHVNEAGTVAAAAAAVVMKWRGAAARPMPPIPFRADHPFLFLIRDNRTGSIPFLGRLEDPEG